MGIMRVNPTRMELTRLKKRLKVARRGHKLLKDKRDELMKQFLETVRKAKDLRERVEEGMAGIHRKFLTARAEMSRESMEEALMLPSRTIALEVGSKNVMSVEIPTMTFKSGDENPGTLDILPYGFHFTSGELDDAVLDLSRLMLPMLELAALEKAAQLMAAEIERTRRRVNALEYVMIPGLEESVRYITMKLEENERGNITRLMKVKSMVLERARTGEHG
ncbi:MAG TPA: V-type ATP synthase subunit D [Clostridiales bacterium]|nr:V-type ATP synthase subunit D [Clostridiales bacterium]